MFELMATYNDMKELLTARKQSNDRRREHQIITFEEYNLIDIEIRRRENILNEMNNLMLEYYERH